MAWGGLFLSLGRPSQEQQKSCLASASGFNYDAALQGASTPKSATALNSEDTDRALADRGFSVNRSRVLIGSGADTFVRAKSALLSWKHLALGWAEVDPNTPVKAGARFCICYKEVFPWVMFPLQIAYVTDENFESSGRKRAVKDGGVFAFGSGTLQGHLLAGEERFSVQVDEEGRVWYEVFSFSKPAHPLSTLCYPYVRFRQRHFAVDEALVGASAEVNARHGRWQEALLLRSEAPRTADCAEAAAVLIRWDPAEDQAGKLRREIRRGRGRLGKAKIRLFAQTRTHGDGSKIGSDGDR